jgi:hypothetical protein
MKEISVSYWHLREYDDLPYEHNTFYPYSDRKRNAIVNLVLSKGYSVMLKPCSDGQTLAIWIDKGNFRQS